MHNIEGNVFTVWVRSGSRFDGQPQVNFSARPSEGYWWGAETPSVTKKSNDTLTNHPKFEIHVPFLPYEPGWPASNFNRILQTLSPYI